MKTEHEKILRDYFDTFGQFPPEPFGVDDDFYFKVLDDHIKKGEPVSDEFEWWDIPDDAVS